MKKKIVEIAFLFIFLLAMAFYMDSSEGSLDGNNIRRNKVGEGSQQVDLILNAKGLKKDYKYSVDVKEELPTKEQADKYIDEAREEIDNTFCSEGEEIDHVTQNLHMKESYVEGIVEAEWTLSDYSIVNTEGLIQQDQVSDTGSMIEATVHLTCNEYEREYSFDFVVYKQNLSNSEKLIQDIDNEIEKSLNTQGKTELELPKQVDGIDVTWKEKKTGYVYKIIILEIVMIILIYLTEKERKKKDIEKRKVSMQLDYPEIVSKMAILLGAGMTIEQAWNRITASYYMKRQKKQCGIKPAYDEMIITAREISDGESGRKAYQRFSQRVDLGCYQRFIRILLQSLVKGNKGICTMLEKESDDAFKERKLLAKKLGEEASTKMLVPLMLMMIVVMAIIIAPAVLSFKG